MTPACRKAALYAASEPARLPVCDDTAREPEAVTPDLIATTGFWRVILRATSMNLCPSGNPST